MVIVRDIVIIVAFLFEVSFLLYVEKKIWKTWYTPLIFLMVPYALVFFITIVLSFPGNSFGFDQLYVPSVILWMVGLTIFAIPSFTIGYASNKSQLLLNKSIDIPFQPKVVSFLQIVVCLLLALRLIQVLNGSQFLFGSDEFGLDFCGSGLWAHLRELSIALLIFSIYFIDKRHIWLLFVILPTIFYLFAYSVKGWIIIPCFAAWTMRVYFGKSRFSIFSLLYLALFAVMVFFVAYTFSLVVAGDAKMGEEMNLIIFGKFFHYLTSGILGLSDDMLLNFPDQRNFQVILAPFVNLFKVVVGDGDLVNVINPFFINTGIDLTNVRTFFGTLFINSDYIQFVVYILLISSIMYCLKLIASSVNNLYLYLIYFYECSLLGMGWFEFYFFHLDVIEIPLMLLVIWLFVRLLSNGTDNTIVYERK